MDSWFLLSCHATPCPQAHPTPGPPQQWGDGDTEEHGVTPRAYAGQRSRDRESPQFPCLEGGHHCPGVQDGVLRPRRQEGTEACRGADGGGVGRAKT